METVKFKGFKFRRTSLESSEVISNEAKKGLDTGGSNYERDKAFSSPSSTEAGSINVAINSQTSSATSSSGKENKLKDYAHLLPKCQHNRICDVRMVRKSEENRGRLYFSCSIPRNGKCDFFKVRKNGRAELYHSIQIEIFLKFGLFI